MVKTYPVYLAIAKGESFTWIYEMAASNEQEAEESFRNWLPTYQEITIIHVGFTHNVSDFKPVQLKVVPLFDYGDEKVALKNYRTKE